LKLYDYIEEIDISKYDLNWAEQIVCGANNAYDLGITRDDVKMAASLGGGMAVRGACGAMVGAVLIIGRVKAVSGGHFCPSLKLIVKEYIHRFEEELESQNCDELREIHNKDCRMIIDVAAKILDEVLEK